MEFDIDRRELLKATGAGIATITVTSGTAAGQEPNLDGSGTENDPYVIRSLDDLFEIDNDLGAYYVLEEDVVFDQEGTIMPLAFAETMEEDPEDFTGTLDGQGNSITGLNIEGFSAYDDAGFFGSIGDGGVVKNLDLVNLSVEGNAAAGGVAGEFDGGADGKISNVSVSGNVVGGFDGAGGLVGVMISGAVADSDSSAGVNGDQNLGGAIGDMSGGDVARTFSEGTVTAPGESSNQGGFVGQLSGGRITESYATGNVDGSFRVGGFVGEMLGGEINQAYAWGDVSGFVVGSFVGFFGDGSIEEVYAVGEVIAEGGGGLVGEVPMERELLEGTVEDATTTLQSSLGVAYWDEVSTGRANAIGSGSIPLGNNVEGFATDDGQGRADEMTGDDAPDNMLGFDFDNTWVTVTGDENPIIGSRPAETQITTQATQPTGPGYPVFGWQLAEDEEDCINRRNLGRGQEDEECPVDSQIERGGSRRNLDRESGRGGDGRHRDSSTARRDRGRGGKRGR